MKVLSFDVGIKNLAFCLLDETSIRDWGILNISCDQVCSREGCDKSAKIQMKHPSTQVCECVCPSHAKLKCYSEWKSKNFLSVKMRYYRLERKWLNVSKDIPIF